MIVIRIKPLKRHLPAFLVFAALTVLLTWPLVTQVNTHLAQYAPWGTDAFNHTYVLWWFKEALLRFRTLPSDLRLIAYPYGGYYPLLHTFAATYGPGVVLQLFFSPAAAYNLLILKAVLLCSLFGYALTTYITGDRWAGLFGGVVYGFFPSHMVHAFSGHPEHTAIYSFPLYLLLLYKLCRRPAWRKALACGLTLAFSMLVQPMYVPFLLIPMTLAVLATVFWAERYRLNRRRALMLGGAFGLAILVVLPFYLPVLREQLDQASAYLQEDGIETFSADVLGMVSPSPLNPVLEPLGLIPNYARDAIATDFRIADTLTYAGVVALGLALVAIITQPRRALPWLIVAIGAWVLSLGPVLRVRGRVFEFVVEGTTTAVALPYALLMDLPFLSYNRAPSRLAITMMLAMAVLNAYAVAWLLKGVRTRWRAVPMVLLISLTLAESLVLWPFPTSELQVPSTFSTLAHASESLPVLSYPATWHTQQMALYYQTVHRQPIFGGWVQRELTSPIIDPYPMLNALLAPRPDNDIVPPASADALLAVAQAEGVAHVALHTAYVDDPAKHAQQLGAIFGPSLSADGQVTIFAVPQAPEALTEVVYALPEQSWYRLVQWDERPARWVASHSELFIYSPQAQAGVLSLVALPLGTTQRVEVEVNGATIGTLVIGDPLTYTTPVFDLMPGQNLIRFISLDPCLHVQGDPRCDAVSRAAGAACDPYMAYDDCLTLLVKELRFVPQDTVDGDLELQVSLGERVSLLGYRWDTGATEPGRPLALTLLWQALRPLEDDYIIFAHVLDAAGRLVSQHDAPPLQGIYPTSAWRPEEIFTHPVTLLLPDDLPPGAYALLVGMYSYPDIQRLPVDAARPYAADGLLWLETVHLPSLIP